MTDIDDDENVTHISVIIDSLHYCGITGTDDDENVIHISVISNSLHYWVVWLIQMMMRMSSTFM